MAILELKDVRLKEFGTYTCTARNKFGEASESVILKQVESSDIRIPRFTSQLQVFSIPSLFFKTSLFKFKFHCAIRSYMVCDLS